MTAKKKTKKQEPRRAPIETFGIVRSSGWNDGATGVTVEVIGAKGPQSAIDRTIFVALSFGDLGTILRSVSVESIVGIDGVESVIALLSFADRLDRIESGEVPYLDELSGASAPLAVDEPVDGEVLDADAEMFDA